MQEFKKENYRIMLSWTSKRVSDPVLRFIFLWIAINHWYRKRYEGAENRLSDRACVEKIKSDYQLYHRLLNNRNLSRDIEESFIKAIEITKKLKFKYVPKLLLDSQKFPDSVNYIDQSEENYKVIIEMIYELRNKIFHGEIAINDENTNDLAKSINIFLEYFIGMIVLNPKVTK